MHLKKELDLILSLVTLFLVIFSQIYSVYFVFDRSSAVRSFYLERALLLRYAGGSFHSDKLQMSPVDHKQLHNFLVANKLSVFSVSKNEDQTEEPIFITLFGTYPDGWSGPNTAIILKPTAYHMYHIRIGEPVKANQCIRWLINEQTSIGCFDSSGLITINVPANKSLPVNVEIVSDSFIIPSKVGNSTDQRKLSFKIIDVREE